MYNNKLGWPALLATMLAQSYLMPAFARITWHDNFEVFLPLFLVISLQVKS